jgi:MFS family permease
LVSDLVEPADRGRAFGHIRAMDHAGAALGPLLAMLFLLAFPGRERLLFLLAILPGLVTLAVIWKTVRDAPTRTAVAARTALAPSLSRPQALLLGSVGVWSLGAASEQFLLMRATELGVPTALVPLVWLVMSLAKSGSATICGRLADRWHPRLALAAGWLWQQGPAGPSCAFAASALLATTAFGLLLATVREGDGRRKP